MLCESLNVVIKLIGACTTISNFCFVIKYMRMSLHEALYVDFADLADFTDGYSLMINTYRWHIITTSHGHNREKFSVAMLADFGAT